MLGKVDLFMRVIGRGLASGLELLSRGEGERREDECCKLGPVELHLEGSEEEDEMMKDLSVQTGAFILVGLRQRELACPWGLLCRRATHWSDARPKCNSKVDLPTASRLSTPASRGCRQPGRTSQ